MTILVSTRLYTAFPAAPRDGFLAGTLTVAGEPAARGIRVLERETSALVRAANSRPDGTFRIERIPLGKIYYLVGLDTQRQYNAAVADLIEPVAYSEV